MSCPSVEVHIELLFYRIDTKARVQIEDAMYEKVETYWKALAIYQKAYERGQVVACPRPGGAFDKPSVVEILSSNEEGSGGNSSSRVQSDGSAHLRFGPLP